MLYENIHFMWLSGMSHPDFRTLNIFRSTKLTDGRFENIFTQVVELLHDEGLISLNVQYYTFVWKGPVEKYKEKLTNKIKAVLEQADAMNNGQTKHGYNIQIATENQFITNYDTFWRPNDQATLIPFLLSFAIKYGITNKEIVADSGYGSEMKNVCLIWDTFQSYQFINQLIVKVVHYEVCAKSQCFI